MAQETNKTEYRLTVGDTIIWQSFEKPINIGYSISGRNFIDFQPIGFGEKLQIIAMKKGKSQITAKKGDEISIAVIIVEEPYVAPTVIKVEKPATQTFTGTYKFTPPVDHFFVTVTNPERDCRETFVKIGNEEAFSDGQGIDRFWNKKTGKNWYYRPEAQGWTDDVDWEFEPFGESFFPLNSFANEVKTNNLSQYYVGMERVLGVNCWHFFVDDEDGSSIQYWVDPSNGCTLRRQVNSEKPREVTVYDLKYPKWYFGPKFKKSLHDTTR
jgi:hypothetical protein